MDLPGLLGLVSISLWGVCEKPMELICCEYFLIEAPEEFYAPSVCLYICSKRKQPARSLWEPHPLLNQALCLANSHFAFKKLRLHIKRKRTVAESNASCFISAPSYTPKGPAAWPWEDTSVVHSVWLSIGTPESMRMGGTLPQGAPALVPVGWVHGGDQVITLELSCF